MKKYIRNIAAVLCLCALICTLAACGGGAKMNGTYKYDYVSEVEYGDSILQIPTFMELTVDGDNYDMIQAMDIGGGFATCVGYSGKCTLDGSTITCKAPDKYYGYEATIEDGVAVVDKETKAETDKPEGAEFPETSYTLDKDAGTFKPVG